MDNQITELEEELMNGIEEMARIMQEVVNDTIDYVNENNRAASTRARNGLGNIKKLALSLRKTILSIRAERKGQS